MIDQESTSTRPYLIRALYEWCCDNGFTPYVAVSVDNSVQVPREFVKDGEIVLNVSMEATSSLQLGNDFIEFKARFGGKTREIMVPVGRVIAIYARENGQGMAFPAPVSVASVEQAPVEVDETDEVGDVSSELEQPKTGSAPAAPRVVQLVPHSDPVAGEDGDAPHPPAPAGGGRPALKRIK